ncbi:LMBR1-like membrane protein-domain-containing protein [Umbelopsis sp. AD052]|nr:LMBR1-like membrane protein-domain-containing protein [Umbelopsis sp. AD052]
MPALVGAAWAAYGIAVGALVVFCIGFTRHYQDKHESELFATIVTILGLSLLFATLALVPVDIFLVSSTIDYSTGLKKAWANPDTVYWMTLTIQIIYYICYGLIGVFTFFVIPFTYFYYEESDDDTTSGQRTAAALKYTSFFVAISVILLLMGLFMRQAEHQHPHMDLDWFKHLLSASNGEKALTFVLACLLLLGMLVFISYTAPGLSILPFSMIKGRRRLETEEVDVDARLSECREQQRAIKLKSSPESLSAKDLRRLENLEDEERILLRRRRGIEEEEHSIWQRVLKVARPFEFVIGLVLLALTLVIVVSMFLTIIDKIANSVCGRRCGYIISHPDIFNPINYIFVKLSNFFPLDYVFMIALILYFFLATMAGVVTIGVRVLWVQLYTIQKRATAPQGLMCCTVLLTLSLLALNYTMTAIVAPGYSHFGSQVYCNSTMNQLRNCTGKPELIVPCDIYAPIDICTPTIISTVIDRIVVNTPFFGMFYYYSQWAFLTIFVLGFIAALFRSPRNNVDAETDDAINADEEQALLEDSRRRQHQVHYGSGRDPNPVLSSTAPTSSN